jgi:peptidyl-prolyl cis-trans isomerase B (cyclophilin B)
VAKAQKPGTGSTNKRRRELAAAKYERQVARRADRAARQRRRRKVAATGAAVLAVLGLAGVLLWPRLTSDSTALPEPTPSPSANTTDIGCDAAPDSPRTPEPVQMPKDQLEPGSAYKLKLNTNCGSITIETLPEKAPKTVNAMLWLAEQGYFDGTTCHRLTTKGIFVLQCGDPTGTGSGGPGFEIPDENLPADGKYPKGTVAMANSGPGTSGSQFFIVYKETSLPPNYTVWGKVTSGLPVVERVAEAGVTGEGDDGTPAAPIGILTTKVRPALG